MSDSDFSARVPGPATGRPPAAVVEQRVDGLLQHALLVVDDDLGPKSFTWQIFRYEAARAGLTLGKFVIPNPFGPYEDPRFTAYVVKTWFAGKTAAVNTPAYVRDNIHVSLLAKAYARFASELSGRTGLLRCNPSGYAESQGAFALRFAREMQPRLGIPCSVDLKHQTDFSEPRVRINTDLIDSVALGWPESSAWDDFALHYKNSHPLTP